MTALQKLLAAIEEAARDGTGVVLFHLDPTDAPALLSWLTLGRLHPGESPSSRSRPDPEAEV